MTTSCAVSVSFVPVDNFMLCHTYNNLLLHNPPCPELTTPLVLNVFFWTGWLSLNDLHFIEIKGYLIC